MASMVVHAAMSAAVAVAVYRLPIAPPVKAVLAGTVSFFVHFLLDAVPHGETSRWRGFTTGIPVYLAISLWLFPHGMELLLIGWIACFYGLLPDGLLFLAEQFPTAIWSRMGMSINHRGHWFREIKGFPERFGWPDLTAAAISLTIFLMVLGRAK